MSSITPRETLDRAIDDLLSQVVDQSLMVENSLQEAVTALGNRDVEDAKRIYKADRQINKMHFNIEEQVITLIATQQPMARDLRILAAILEVTTELERMGDYAKGIARITVRIGEEELLAPMQHISPMVALCVDMLHRAVGALLDRDADAARDIPKEDDRVDQYFNTIYQELMEQMISHPETVNQANHLLWVAHNLERVADRVTNVCERIVFVVTGEMLEMDRTDDEWFEEEPW
jgi:phosphate transport system protein